MITTLRPNRISIDLQDSNQASLDHRKVHWMTPSAAFRRIVAKLTAGAEANAARPDEAAPLPEKARREIRLTKSELVSAEATAAREGFSLSRWIVALIKARLDKTP